MEYFAEKGKFMAKKRITQRFAWLAPLRKRQRVFCFYVGMRWDGVQYSRILQGEALPYRVFRSKCPMYNTDTGFPMVYQENKVHNLKLAAAKLDGLLIRPGETFSFWKAVRFADRTTPYKDGLAVVNGKLTTVRGGGLCQVTNLLFWMFLHTPLTVIERHGHVAKDFPEPSSDALTGVDAAVVEGWKDLKVKNETDAVYQIRLSFDERHIIGEMDTDQKPQFVWQVKNGTVLYCREQDTVWEEAQVLQRKLSCRTGEVGAYRMLYQNRCRIGYALPEGTPVVEREEKTENETGLRNKAAQEWSK